MKKISFSIVLLVLCIFISAQVPESFNYQVAVRDGVSNDPLTNQDVSFRMTILKGSSSGESQYSELHNANTGTLGIVNLVIGNGTSKIGDITTIDWGADTYYLKVEIDKTGGTTYDDMGTTQLLSVPYALHSKAAETADDAVKITGDQIIAGNKTFTGTTTVPAPVNATDAATKAYVDALQDKLINGGLLVKDIDGNIYSIVLIGTQTWMVENLRTTKYRNGDLVGTTNPVTLDISSESTPKYQWAYDGNENNVFTYGRIYTWYAAIDNRNLCPFGWHLPTDEEWTTLSTYLGGESIAGGKLKESGLLHWSSPNTNASNESGFTGLPGGGRDSYGGFNSFGTRGIFWSASEINASTVWYRLLWYNDGILYRGSEIKKGGYSVRCIKD